VLQGQTTHFTDEAMLECLIMKVTNQNCIHEEIKFREYLLLQNSEYFVFLSAEKGHKD
jgi:hypothetical protein